MPVERINVLVTGGAGYIGSHTCKALHHAGYNPITFDNLERGHASAVKWGPLEQGDLQDTLRLIDVMHTYQPLAVIHFAAYAYVGESVSAPDRYYLNNVYGSMCLLQAMRSAGVERIVFSSTCATYGAPESLPLRESHPQRPLNPYGQSKLMVEQLLADYSVAFRLEYVVLRYFNAAGADPSGEIGEVHDPEPHLIPNALKAADSNVKLSVFGTDYETPDGTCVRDYIHVSDLADAHVLALGRLANSGSNEIYNLGNGSGYSVREVIAAVEQVTGRTVAFEEVPRRPGDPAILVADAELARTRLGWVPKYPPGYTTWCCLGGDGIASVIQRRRPVASETRQQDESGH